MRPGRDKPIDLASSATTPPAARFAPAAKAATSAISASCSSTRPPAIELKKAIDDIAAQIPPEKLKGYVVDLRNNPGGTLDGAIAAADGFLDDGEIVAIGDRTSDKVERIRAKAGDLANGKPIVVLINGGSAAKAEIVAGALKDNHRATVVGTRSFGAGWDSTTVPLGPNKGALRLATGQYFTPSGRRSSRTASCPTSKRRRTCPTI